MLSEGQRNDINFAIPVLEHINIEGSRVLADRGYDSQNLIDYIYEYGGEPTIPSKKGAKFERRCDWWLYKERHLVEKYFLKLKGFRRIATRYDKLAFTYMGFVCLASILIWIKWPKAGNFQTRSSFHLWGQGRIDNHLFQMIQGES
jgi:transposase